MSFFGILRVGLIVLEVLLIFNLLIIVHELGHFLAARWRGLHVEKFGIWFGRPLWKKRINGIEFSLGCIPAGGYVMLPQMAPMETIEGKPTVAAASLPSVSPLDKIIVAFAGPLFSFLLALVFAIVVWAVGRPTAEAEATTVVGMVVPDEPAAKAGFQPGDKILAVDGHPVARFAGIVNSVMWYIVRSEGDTISFKVQRGDQILNLQSGYTRPETNGWERKSLREVGLLPAITPIIAKVQEGSIGEAAGLKRNDEVLAVSGERLYRPEQIIDWEQKHPGQPLNLTVRRNGQLLNITLQPSRPVIHRVIKNSPADVAGVKPGDRVLALNDEQVYDPSAVVHYIDEHPDSPFSLTLQENGQQKVVRVLPAPPDGHSKRIIGVDFLVDYDGISWDGGGQMTIVHISPLEQISAALQTLTNTVGALLSPQSDIKLQHMSGPVMIMRTYYLLFESDFGWQLALWFSVVFNINLAVINLLPIPVLDGGHIVLALLEALRGRPMNLRLLEIVQGACAILLIGFMLYVSFYDVQDLNVGQRTRFSVPAKPAPPATDP